MTNTLKTDGEKAAAMRKVAQQHAAELPVGAVRATVEEVAALPSASLAMLYDAITSFRAEG